MGLPHTCLQAPQFLGSVLMFVSHPFSGLPSQSARSFEHIIPPELLLLVALVLPATVVLAATLVLLATLEPLVTAALVLVAPAPP